MRKLLLNGWYRLHIILSLSPAFISFICYQISGGDLGSWLGISCSIETFDEAGNTVSGMTEHAAWVISICSFVVYWIIVGLIFWIKKGFKEE